MGRIWAFFDQDSNEAMDRLLKPYADFMRRHLWLMLLVDAAVLVAVWIFVSRTLALVMSRWPWVASLERAKADEETHRRRP